MQKYIIRRLILVIPTIWLVVSLLFLALRALPGDFVTRKLSNLENQGAEQRDTTVVGDLEVEPTTHRVLVGDTLESIAIDNDVSVSAVLALNPDLTAASLKPGTRVVIIPGQLLEKVAVQHLIVLPEDAVVGEQLLLERNPGIDFELFDGKPFAAAGTTLILRESVTITDLAQARRIEAQDILNANPSGSAANPDGTLAADTLLYPGEKLVLPTTKITEASIRHRLGIDKPMGVQYYEFLWETMRLQFRPSFQTQEDSLDIFLRALPRSLHLMVYSLIVGLSIAFPVGILSAMRQDKPIDYVLRGFSILALAAPSFWIATMMIFVVTPGGVLHGGLWSIPLTSEEARSIFTSVSGFFGLYTIPAVAGGIAAGAGLMRITRSELLEVLRQDYVRTAWAKGLRERTVIRRHVMRNAMVNVLSVLGLSLAALVGGNIILELLFNIPGIGLLLIQRINQADIPVVQTMVFFLALFVIIVNIVVDMTYALIDPRIRYT